MDIDNESLGIPDQKYPCVIDMPSAEFHRTVKDIATFSDTLTISATKAGVVFSGKGGGPLAMLSPLAVECERMWILDSTTNTVTYTNGHTVDEDDKEVSCGLKSLGSFFIRGYCPLFFSESS